MLRGIQGGLGLVVLLAAGMAAGQGQSQPAAGRQLSGIPPQCTYVGKVNGENIPVYCKASPAPSEIATPLQANPPANPNTASQSPAPNQGTQPAADAPPPSPAQAFPFPEEDSKSKELPGQHAQPAPVPDAPVPDAPQGNGANAHPYPGDSGGGQPAPDGGGYSSSSDRATGNPDAGSLPDATVPKKPELQDAGSSGQVNPARADNDMSIADFYIKDGNYAGAYLRYKDAVVFDPDNADAHFALAEMARKTGKPAAEAIEQYSAGLKIDPQNKHAKEARKALSELQAAGKK